MAKGNDHIWSGIHTKKGYPAFAKRSNLQVAHISLSLKKKKIKETKNKKEFLRAGTQFKELLCSESLCRIQSLPRQKETKRLKAANKKGLYIGKFWQRKGAANDPQCLGFQDIPISAFNNICFLLSFIGGRSSNRKEFSKPVLAGRKGEGGREK